MNVLAVANYNNFQQKTKNDNFSALI